MCVFLKQRTAEAYALCHWSFGACFVFVLIYENAMAMLFHVPVPGVFILDTGVTVVLCSSTLIHFGISCSYLLVRVCLCVVLVAIESAFLHNLWIQLEHAGTGNPGWRFKLLHISPQNCNFSRQLTYRETTQVDLPSLMSQKEVIAQLYHSSCVSKHDLLHCCYISFLASNYRLNIVKLGDMISNHGFYRGWCDFQLLK